MFADIVTWLWTSRGVTSIVLVRLKKGEAESGKITSCPSKGQYESVPLILPTSIFGHRWITRAHRTLQKYGGHFSGGKKTWATYSQVRGLQKYGPSFLKNKKNSLEQRTHQLGASRNMGAFFSGENSLEQRIHKLGASRNMGGGFFLGETALSNVPTS